MGFARNSPEQERQGGQPCRFSLGFRVCKKLAYAQPPPVVEHEDDLTPF